MEEAQQATNLRPRYRHFKHESSGYYEQGTQQVELFPFDPNTADSTQLLKLGLRPWQVRNIYKYRSKGGIYRKPSDFARLYGLTVKQYRMLEPYIRISSDYLPASTLIGEQAQSHASDDNCHQDSTRYPVKLKKGETIVLNQADTSELKKVPGIGSAYARAILRYGNRLGGYVSTTQLLEIDGVPESALPYFVLGKSEVRKMNVNKLSLNQLRNHPYIGFYRAKAIVDYRRLHGNLKSLKELSLSPDFSDDIIKKLLPYVDY